MQIQMQIMKSMFLAGTMAAMMNVAAHAEETPPVPGPATNEDVRRVLGVVPGGLHGTKPLVANADGQARIRIENGHYYPRVTINGVGVRMVADTGATSVYFSAEDARKIGINPQSLQFTGQAHTANGTVRTAPFTLPQITVEGFVLRDVRASCCVTGESLLGMSALERLIFKIDGGWMFLSPRR
jgi:clan AA aspartic protease (TIGR02281 family)